MSEKIHYYLHLPYQDLDWSSTSILGKRPSNIRELDSS